MKRFIAIFLALGFLFPQSAGAQQFTPEDLRRLPSGSAQYADICFATSRATLEGLSQSHPEYALYRASQLYWYLESQRRHGVTDQDFDAHFALINPYIDMMLRLSEDQRFSLFADCTVTVAEDLQTTTGERQQRAIAFLALLS